MRIQRVRDSTAGGLWCVSGEAPEMGKVLEGCVRIDGIAYAVEPGCLVRLRWGDESPFLALFGIGKLSEGWLEWHGRGILLEATGLGGFSLALDFTRQRD